MDSSHLVMGVKQTLRALHAGKALRVILAQDAARHVVEPVDDLARRQAVPVQWVPTMRELGQAGGLQVGCACAAQLEK